MQEILDRDAAYEAALSDPFAVPAAPETSPPRAPRDEPAEPAAPYVLSNFFLTPS